MACHELQVENNIQEIHCETANDILEYLRPSHDRWLAYNWQSVWIFRGHRREVWELEPSALRKGGHLEPFKREFNSYMEMIKLVNGLTAWNVEISFIDSLCKQTAAEQKAIHEFIEKIDAVGLQVPDDSISRDFQLDFVEFVQRLFNDRELRRPWYLSSDVVALAQHHGIPTRLLDWTENPWVATFFAASGEVVDETENIAVWALRREATDRDCRSGLRLFIPRRSRIGYLQAQRGLFVYDIMANQYYLTHGTWRTFKTVITNLHDDLPFPYWLRKITLPASQADELLLRLEAHKLDRPFLMPTYDNVASALLKRYRDKQQ